MGNVFLLINGKTGVPGPDVPRHVVLEFRREGVCVQGMLVKEKSQILESATTQWDVLEHGAHGMPGLCALKPVMEEQDLEQGSVIIQIAREMGDKSNSAIHNHAMVYGELGVPGHTVQQHAMGVKEVELDYVHQVCNVWEKVFN